MKELTPREQSILLHLFPVLHRYIYLITHDLAQQKDYLMFCYETGTWADAFDLQPEELTVLFVKLVAPPAPTSAPYPCSPSKPWEMN